MAVTKFKGPINSIDGFQLDGTAVTMVATQIVTPQTVTGSSIELASDAGLSTVLWGIAKHNSVVHGATYLYARVETSKNGVVGSSASYQLTYFQSTQATFSVPAGKYAKAASIDVLLIGAG